MYKNVLGKRRGVAHWFTMGSLAGAQSVNPLSPKTLPEVRLVRTIVAVRASPECQLNWKRITIVTVLPLACGWVDDAEQFVVGHSLGVEVVVDRLALHVLVGLNEGLPHLRLPCASVADQEHRVSHF